MKLSKLYTVLAAAVAVAGFSSCSENTEPVYHEPTAESFKIYDSPFMNQYYELTPDGTFEITLNGQPDYGVSTVTQYRLQVSLTEDFKEFDTMTPVGTGTLSKMTLKESRLAMAICKLRNIYEESEWTDLGEQKIYLRGQAFIKGVESSNIVTSNITVLNRVQSYFNPPVPGTIYVIGNYVVLADNKWIEPLPKNAEQLQSYVLSEKDDEIESKKYYGTIDFLPYEGTTGSVFRFYTELGSWDENTLGCSGGPDNDKPVEFPDFVAGSVLDHGLAKTKDSFSFPNYRGKLEFFVDLSDSDNPKVQITAPKE